MDSEVGEPTWSGGLDSAVLSSAHAITHSKSKALQSTPILASDLRGLRSHPLNETGAVRNKARTAPARCIYWILLGFDCDRLGFDFLNLREGEGQDSVLEISLGLIGLHHRRQLDRA